MEMMGIETANDAIETYKSLGDWRYADKEAAWRWMFEAGQKHAISESVQKDSARFRWIRNNPQWIGYDSDFRPDEVEKQIDAAMSRNG